MHIFWPSPPLRGGAELFSKLKNREEFEGGLHEKGKEKRGDKTHVKIPL